jgi:histidinol dehydrogenase
MRRIERFAEAKRLLTRENLWESFTATPRMAAEIKQAFGEELSPQQVVERIVNEVRSRGDQAVFDYTSKLDKVSIDSMEVSKQEVRAAYNKVDKELISAFHLAAKRIHHFHSTGVRKAGRVTIDKYLRRELRPLGSVGLYVPGGTAAYPSTVLMMAIPAKVAAVEEVIMVSPPGKNGTIPAATLVAADIAQVDRVFRIGGAQAIAALAFGTASIPRVDKICGPGNVFVTLAKRMVYGVVAIDGLRGPSEIVLVADETANASLCAADLLAQAEHDPLASIALITTSSELIEKLEKEIVVQLSKLPRRSIANQAFDRGTMVLVNNLNEAVELVNLFAPEHLSIMAASASRLIPEIKNAGCIFVGEDSPVVLGDYTAGPSHVLPTGGSARFSSPLGVDDFLKVINIVAFDKPIMQELSLPAMTIAKAEGLDAHAEALQKRLKT